MMFFVVEIPAEAVCLKEPLKKSTQEKRGPKTFRSEVAHDFNAVLAVVMIVDAERYFHERLFIRGSSQELNSHTFMGTDLLVFYRRIAMKCSK